jgi:hypothetical protein
LASLFGKFKTSLIEHCLLIAVYDNQKMGFVNPWDNSNLSSVHHCSFLYKEGAEMFKVDQTLAAGWVFPYHEKNNDFL